MLYETPNCRYNSGIKNQYRMDLSLISKSLLKIFECHSYSKDYLMPGNSRVVINTKEGNPKFKDIEVELNIDLAPK